MAKYENIRALAKKQLQAVTESSDRWKAFLRTAAIAYNYSFPNQLLIHEQSPTATAVADIAYWNNNAGRWVKRGAHGIAVFDTRANSSRLRYLFDISDTIPRAEIPEALPWVITDQNWRPVWDKIVADNHADSIQSALLMLSTSCVAQRSAMFTTALGKAIDGSSLQWAKPDEQRQLFLQLITQSCLGYTVKYGPRVEHMAVRHKDAQRNIRIDRLDPRFSETALREYYRQLHRMPTEMQQEYRQENAPAKPKWQPTELQPTVRRARYLGKLPRRYPKVSGFMACYYHYCALLRKAYHGKSTKRCYFLLREDFLLFSRYQQQTKFLWENHIETMDELLAYKENAEVQIQQLARQRKVLYRQKREPERAAREEKIKSLTQQMKALRHEVYICSDIETDAAEVQEKLRQAELAAQEERNEVKQDEQRRRSSRSDGAGSLTGYRSSH